MLVHTRPAVQEHPCLDMYTCTSVFLCLPLRPSDLPLSQHPIWPRLCSTCSPPTPPTSPTPPHSNPSTVLIWCWSDGQHFEQQTDRLALIPWVPQMEHSYADLEEGACVCQHMRVCVWVCGHIHEQTLTDTNTQVRKNSYACMLHGCWTSTRTVNIIITPHHSSLAGMHVLFLCCKYISMFRNWWFYSTKTFYFYIQDTNCI